MTRAAAFLTSLGRVVSTMNLYEEGHPARERAIDTMYGHLVELQEETLRVRFTFLASEVVFQERPLRELAAWGWGPRLSRAGVQRLEFVDRVTRDDFEAFLQEIYPKLAGESVSTAQVRQGRPSAIRYGEVGLKGRGGEGGAFQGSGVVTATMGYSLQEEVEGVEWMHEELREDRHLHMVEAEGIVRSLSVAMHGDQAYMIPLLRLKDFDQYTVTHTLNVSVLTMALAEHLGLSPKEVRAFGIAGLLHDLGKVKIPNDILNKPGKLTEAEFKVMNNHTTEGARLIMETEEHLDLAAVVAYEHHIKIDGGGYPQLRYPRACHQASNLVHVCDVFDALRTHRPYREAWSTERALSIIEEGAGPEFDKEIAHAFIDMMKKWEGRIAELDVEQPELKHAAAANGDGGAPASGEGAGDGAAPTADGASPTPTPSPDSTEGPPSGSPASE